MHIIFGLLFLCCSCFGDLIYPTNFDPLSLAPNNYITIASYPLLRFNWQFKSTNLTVVDLQWDQSVFDYCDIKQYNEKGIIRYE